MDLAFLRDRRGGELQEMIKGVTKPNAARNAAVELCKLLKDSRKPAD
ncbi:MAG: hypothetical protein IPK83_09860 [Planctomycetes bacterium]|nr:hypothetical protein [Planctomycetota bacterium]